MVRACQLLLALWLSPAVRALSKGPIGVAVMDETIAVVADSLLDALLFIDIATATVEGRIPLEPGAALTGVVLVNGHALVSTAKGASSLLVAPLRNWRYGGDGWFTIDLMVGGRALTNIKMMHYDAPSSTLYACVPHNKSIAAARLPREPKRLAPGPIAAAWWLSQLSLPGLEPYSLLADGECHLWVTGQGGLLRVALDTGMPSQKPDIVKLKLEGFVRALARLRDGRMLGLMGDSTIRDLGSVAAADERRTAHAGERSAVSTPRLLGMRSCGFLDGCGRSARFSRPHAMALAANATALVVSDTDNHALRLITFGGRY